MNRPILHAPRVGQSVPYELHTPRQAINWLRAMTLLCLVTLLQLCTLLAHAAPFTPADEKSVRGVVESQIAAFAQDNAGKAFSYAAPSLRKEIGSAEAFMDMVRRAYPAVYRPASVAFLTPEGKGDEVIQRVQLTDSKGDSWLAVYTLKRQTGNVWRITGCALLENKGRMA